MQVSSQTQQVFNRIDTNRDGVSLRELRTLDSDRSGKISQAEAQAAGLDPKDLDAINRLLEKCASHAPSEIVFPRPGQAAPQAGATPAPKAAKDLPPGPNEVTGPAEFGLTLVRDPQLEFKDDPNKAGTAEQLRQSLGIPQDWKGSEHVRSLIGLLESKGELSPQTFAYLERIGKQHNPVVLNDVCNLLAGYRLAGKVPQDPKTASGPDAARSAERFKKDVVEDALRDLALPSGIDQANRPTCGAAAMQMKQAIEKPVRYVALLTTLAQGKSYPTAGGGLITPNDSWKKAWKTPGNADTRSYSARILQDSLSGFSGLENFDSTIRVKPAGTTSTGQNRVLQSLGGPAEKVDVDYGSGDKLFKYAEDELAHNRSVVVGFKGHAVLVVGIDKTQSPPVVRINSWGKQYTMPIDKFKEQVQSVQNVDDSGWDEAQTAGNRFSLVGDR